MKTHVMTLLTLLLGSSLFLAASGLDDLPRSAPGDAGFSVKGLQELDAAIQEHIDERKVAGAQTLIARKGKIVHFANYGKQDLESGKAMATDAIFRIYSMTKPITAVAVMMLQEQGKLKLDDPLSKFLPKFADMNVYVGDKDGLPQYEPLARPITLRHLLTHTAGFTYGFFGNTFVDQQYRKIKVFETKSLSALMDRLAELPLLYQPGEQWHYSVANDVLGAVVEVASGQSFDQFLAERIFVPLDMTDTGFFVPESKMNRFAGLYQPSKDGLQRVMTDETKFDKSPDILSGGGGLVSTTADYFRFCSMMLNGGVLDGTRLLKKESVAEMVKNQLSASALSKFRIVGCGYGLGFSVVLDKDKSPASDENGLFRWGGLANTSFWIDPENEMICIFMTQLFPGRNPIRAEFQELVYGAMTN